MRERLAQRVRELNEQLERCRARKAQLDSERQQLDGTMTRISEAIDVLREELDNMAREGRE